MQAHSELESINLHSSSLQQNLSSASSRAARAEKELENLKRVESELQNAQVGLNKQAKSASKAGEQVASLKDKLASMHRALQLAEVEKSQLQDECRSIGKKYTVRSMTDPAGGGAYDLNSCY
jgi:chromosome segregation ATPase